MSARAGYRDITWGRGRPACPRCDSAATVSLGTARSTLEWWRCEDCSFVCGLPPAVDLAASQLAPSDPIRRSRTARARLSSLLSVTMAWWPALTPF